MYFPESSAVVCCYTGARIKLINISSDFPHIFPKTDVEISMLSLFTKL